MGWEEKITLQENTTSDAFGYSVAIHGNYAIVGAPNYDEGPGGTNAGAVYFYQRNRNGNWELDKDSTKYGENTGDFFGTDVAIHGNYAIVGAPDYDEGPGGTNAGAVYFYQRNRNGKWELDEDSTKYGENAGDRFGYSIAIHGNYAIVGAHNYDIVPGSGTDEGAVYFYQRNRNGKWELDKDSTKYGENTGDNFGQSVAIHGNYAIVGAPRYDEGPGGNNEGAVYFYQRNRNGNWELDKDSTKYGENTDDFFGWSVAIHGNYAIVGASGSSAEKAYLYLRKNNGKWVNVSEQYNPIEKGDSFGTTVGLFGNYAIVGGAGGGAGSGGVAAIYQRMY